MEALTHTPAPALAALLLLAFSTAIGTGQVARLIRLHEARHELRHGSAEFIRTLSGWSVIALWIMAVWFVATVIGDWSATGDLSGALDRAALRLRLLLEIAVALMDSD